MPGGEESWRKGAYSTPSTEMGATKASGPQAKALISCVQAHHCVWADSQQNEGLPLRLCARAGGPTRAQEEVPEGPARRRREGRSGGLTTPAEPVLKMQPGTSAA